MICKHCVEVCNTSYSDVRLETAAVTVTKGIEDTICFTKVEIVQFLSVSELAKLAACHMAFLNLPLNRIVSLQADPEKTT